MMGIIDHVKESVFYFLFFYVFVFLFLFLFFGSGFCHTLK